MNLTQAMVEFLNENINRDLIVVAHNFRTKFKLTEVGASELIEIWQDRGGII